jgi:hypothetical protein
MKVQLIMDFTILMKQTVANCKAWIWTFISQCVYSIDVKI